MSNARNLANLLSPGASTLASAAIADDAITAAKIDDDGTGFTVGDLSVTNDIAGNISGRILLDASASGTDVGDEFLLNATDGSASNDGGKIVFEEGTDDVSALLKDGLPSGITINTPSLPAGCVVQQVSTVTGESSTTTSRISYDDTRPLNTEGAEVMNATITPKNKNNQLTINVVTHQQNSATGHTVVALFVNTTKHALAATANYMTANWGHSTCLNHTTTVASAVQGSETTPSEALTFRVRIGRAQSTSSTVTFNGEGGGRKLGENSITTTAITNSSIIITEIQA